MRGPEEASSAEGTTSSTVTQDTSNVSERDQCSSPPCKRLKQAVISFQSPTSTSAKKTPGTPSSGKHDNKDSNSDDVVIIDDEVTQPGGLVTAVPSPPVEGLRPSSSASVSSLNDSMSSTSNLSTSEAEGKIEDVAPSTPGSKAAPSHPSSGLTTPANKSAANSKTPKLSSAEKLKKKEEREKLKAERQKQKEEKEKERLEAKAAKEKERLEAKQKKEQERLEKQAEKEKKEKERLEKKQKEERELQEKKDKKEEEKKKKEEEINAKLEEKRKKDEDKRRQDDEQMKKKQLAKRSFANFFISAPVPAVKTLPKSTARFQPFQITEFMTLAPTTRITLQKEPKGKMDALMMKQDASVPSYLQELSSRKPLSFVKARRRSKRIKQVEDTSEEEPMDVDADSKDNLDPIVIADDENSNSSSIVELEQKKDDKKCMKAILLQFKENYRPAYYGTHRKKSKKISPRNPFKKDEVLLDYDVDSDEEWEEEEPGESLSDSEGEDAEDGETDDKDEGDGFFVPHGYLSDDEGIEAEDGEGNTEGREEQQMAKAKQWEAELKRKFKPLRPIAMGCLWNADAEANDFLKQFEAISMSYDASLNINPCTEPESSDMIGNTNVGSTSDGVHPAAMIVPEEAMPDLIQYVHGNTAGVLKLMKHFKEFWSSKCLPSEGKPAPEHLLGKGHISRRQLERKIQAIAIKERRYDKLRWYVHQNILEKYGLQGLEVPRNISPAPEVMADSKISPPKPGIKYFTKATSPSFGAVGAQQKLSVGSGVHNQIWGPGNNVKPIGKVQQKVPTSHNDVIVIDDEGPNKPVIAKRRIIPTLVSGEGNTVLNIAPSASANTESGTLKVSAPQANQVGKRRIAPTLISTPMMTDAKSTPSGTPPSSGGSANLGSVSQSRQVTGKRRIVPTLMSAPSVADVKTPSASQVDAASSPADACQIPSAVSKGNQRKQVAPKRRITPTLIPTPCVNDTEASPNQVPVKRRIAPILISSPTTGTPSVPSPPSTSTGSTDVSEVVLASKMAVVDNEAAKPNHVAKRRVVPTLISGLDGVKSPPPDRPSAVPSPSVQANDGTSPSIHSMNTVVNSAEGSHNTAVKRLAPSPGHRAAKIAKKGDPDSNEGCSARDSTTPALVALSQEGNSSGNKSSVQVVAANETDLNASSLHSQEQMKIVSQHVPESMEVQYGNGTSKSVSCPDREAQCKSEANPAPIRMDTESSITTDTCVKSNVCATSATGMDTSLDCASMVAANSFQNPLLESGQVPKSASVTS